MRATLAAYLLADTTLIALLTGSIHTGTQISRQDTPTAFDSNGEIKPCALLKIESEVPSGPYETSSRMFVVVYFYQRSGYTTIDAALARVYTLLHRHKFSSKNVWEVRHTDDVCDQEDQAMGCSVSFSRYEIVRRR